MLRTRKPCLRTRTPLCLLEPLETRTLLSASPLLTPAHIVIVLEEDRFCNVIGDPSLTYINGTLANGALIYTNSHGVTHPGEPDYYALYSGSTQGVTDEGTDYSFSGPNLAQSLDSASTGAGQYLSFASYAEGLPADGDTTTIIAPGPVPPATPSPGVVPDIYMRAFNPAAQFTNAGTHGSMPIANAQINKTFADFPNDYNLLPTVSFVIPDNLDNTHGSNETSPFATNPAEYGFLRSNADTWLKNNLNGYLQWAKSNDSLLIITTDEEETDTHPSSTLTTIINGDPRLFVPGNDATSINQYNILRTIENMYGLPFLGNTAAAVPLNTNAAGHLAPPHALAATSTTLVSSISPAIFGQAVTLTATVTPTEAGTPTGAVTFTDGTASIGVGLLDASGQASCTVSSLAAGSHAIVATYGGDATFAASASASLPQTVNQAATVTVVAVPISADIGQSIAFTATVSPVAGDDTVISGTIQFQIDGMDFGAPVPLTVDLAQSALTTSLATGLHAITAIYSGDANFIASTDSALTHVLITPVNNDFADSILLSGNSATATIATAGATKQHSEPDHAGNPGGHSVWWTWIPTASGKVQIDTAGSNFATLLAVYTGGTLKALKPVPGGSDGNDPTGGAFTRKVVFDVKGGVAYRIAVDGYNGATGTAILRVNYSTTPPPPPTAVAASKGAFSTKIRLTWNAGAAATGYQVWRSQSRNMRRAAQINTFDVIGTYFADTTAVSGVTYWYWIKAINASGVSSFSDGAYGYKAGGIPTSRMAHP